MTFSQREINGQLKKRILKMRKAMMESMNKVIVIEQVMMITLNNE
jgi:hypothetical protein